MAWDEGGFIFESGGWEQHNIILKFIQFNIEVLLSIIMGDNVSVEEKKDFQEKLQFVQKAEDAHFGQIEIFRFKEPPYEYIMDYAKTFMEGDYRYSAYIQFVQKLQQKEHKNLAKIHLTQVHKENHMCIKDTKVHTYCNYYNFTLKQAIDKKKARDNRFSESELCYILWCLLDLAVYLKKSGISLGQYRSDRIFLSPEGYIKVFLLEVEKENKHSAYYKALSDKSLIDELILSPEQLYYISRLEYAPNIDIYRADLFAIGMIMLELITLDKTKFYYTEDKSALKMGRISFDLSSFSGDYSADFIDILRSCLLESPLERAELEGSYQRIQELRNRSQNVNYCIRLHEEQEQSQKKKQIMSSKGQYILSGIEKRLTPLPISTMTSSATTGFNSKYSPNPLQTEEKKPTK